ncbi:hypothetical protein [Hymenobacter crusticola]|uniref:Uncharacterized protein n=1 Tax=Hymenobacter crusticola TaxID=1770526 RepID=A0A243W8B8_9BACT|nr:hypothetical protein [Hymenobacter crusticola]OUJ70279.1 hypothetical protein BXP70_24595 [Hymenobacter crusticola]
MTDSPLRLSPGQGVLITLDFTGEVPVQVTFTCTSAASKVELATYFFAGNRAPVAASFSYRNTAREPHWLHTFVTDQQGAPLPATLRYALADRSQVDYGPERHGATISLSVLPLARGEQ